MWTDYDIKQTLLIGIQTILLKRGWAYDPFGDRKEKQGHYKHSTKPRAAYRSRTQRVHSSYNA